jgi:hypothetical protein
VISGDLLLNGIIYFGSWNANVIGNAILNGVVVVDSSSSTLLNATGCVSGNITIEISDSVPPGSSIDLFQYSSSCPTLDPSIVIGTTSECALQVGSYVETTQGGVTKGSIVFGTLDLCSQACLLVLNLFFLT